MCIYITHNKGQPEFWLDALLKILPKSGDKSDPSNCRGIQLLEVMYKILGNIMKVRSQQISEKLDHEAQCGFRIERGTIDGVWNIRMLVDKRREWGAETWLLLIDLVKAFDRVPRSLLWKFMQRFGYPPKFIRMLKMLHTDVKVHFDVNGVQKVINSTIGGKQGDLLFPDLFNLHICAIMQIWRQRRVGADVGLRTKQDFVLGTSTKGNKRASKYGGKYENGAVFKRNGCETVTVKSVSQSLLTEISIVSTNLQLPTRHYTGFMLLISLFRRYIYESFPSYIMRLSSVN